MDSQSIELATKVNELWNKERETLSPIEGFPQIASIARKMVEEHFAIEETKR